MSFAKTITKTITFSKDVTTDFQWIRSETEPTTPAGFERASELDLDFGILGKYWGFDKQWDKDKGCANEKGPD